MTFLHSDPLAKRPQNATDVRETQLQEVSEQVSSNIFTVKNPDFRRDVE